MTEIVDSKILIKERRKTYILGYLFLDVVLALSSHKYSPHLK